MLVRAFSVIVKSMRRSVVTSIGRTPGPSLAAVAVFPSPGISNFAGQQQQQEVEEEEATKRRQDGNYKSCPQPLASDCRPWPDHCCTALGLVRRC